MHTQKHTPRFSLREGRLIFETGAPQEQPSVPPPEQPPLQGQSDVEHATDAEVHAVQDQFEGLAQRGFWGAILAALLRHGVQPRAALKQTNDLQQNPTKVKPQLMQQGITIDQDSQQPGNEPQLQFMAEAPQGGQTTPPRQLGIAVTPEQPNPTATVTESVERFRAGDIAILTDGSVWQRGETGSWTSLLEDYSMGGTERTDDGMNGAVRLPPPEQQRLRRAVESRTMRNQTFLDEQGREWYCRHAGQLHELEPRHESIDIAKGNTAGATMFLQANEELTFLDWRGIVRLPGSGDPLLGQQMNATATVDGITFTRTRYGLQAVAGPDATGGPHQIWMLNKYVTINVADAAVERVDAGDVRPVELGKTEWVRISPANAIARIPAGDLSNPENTLEVPQTARTSVENNFYSVQRFSGYLQITAKAKPPAGVRPSFTLAGSNTVTKNFEIIDQIPKFGTMPGSLEQGAEHRIGQVEPKNAQLQIVPQSGGEPVAFNGPEATVTVDGVTYERREAYSAAYSWIVIRAAADAPLGNRVIRFASGTPSHTMEIIPKPAVRPTTSPSTTAYTPPVETEVQRVARLEAAGRTVDATLADPADYETHSGGPERVRVPAGTVRILDTGTAFLKNGEGHTGTNRFTGWTSVPPESGLPTYNNDYIRQHSSAQIVASDTAAARNPTIGTRVSDTRTPPGRWEYKTTTEGNRWRRVA